MLGTRAREKPALALNLCLLNLRKTKDLEGIRSVSDSVELQDAYRFASEIAIRFMERKYLISLDEILCDPVASRVRCDCQQYRPWIHCIPIPLGSIDLQQARKLQPELLAKVVPHRGHCNRSRREMEAASLPGATWIYLLFDPKKLCMLANARRCGNASASASTTPTIRVWRDGFGRRRHGTAR